MAMGIDRRRTDVYPYRNLTLSPLALQNHNRLPRSSRHVQGLILAWAAADSVVPAGRALQLNMHTHTHIHRLTHTHTRTRTHAHAHADAHAHSLAHAHAHTRTHTHTHTHTHTRRHSRTPHTHTRRTRTSTRRYTRKFRTQRHRHTRTHYLQSNHTHRHRHKHSQMQTPADAHIHTRSHAHACTDAVARTVLHRQSRRPCQRRPPGLADAMEAVLALPAEQDGGCSRLTAPLPAGIYNCRVQSSPAFYRPCDGAGVTQDADAAGTLCGRSACPKREELQAWVQDLWQKGPYAISRACTPWRQPAAPPHIPDTVCYSVLGRRGVVRRFSHNVN